MAYLWYFAMTTAGSDVFKEKLAGDWFYVFHLPVLFPVKSDKTHGGSFFHKQNIKAVRCTWPEG